MQTTNTTATPTRFDLLAADDDRAVLRAELGDIVIAGWEFDDTDAFRVALADELAYVGDAGALGNVRIVRVTRRCTVWFEDSSWDEQKASEAASDAWPATEYTQDDAGENWVSYQVKGRVDPDAVQRAFEYWRFDVESVDVE